MDDEDYRLQRELERASDAIFEHAETYVKKQTGANLHPEVENCLEQTLCFVLSNHPVWGDKAAEAETDVRNLFDDPNGDNQEASLGMITIIREAIIWGLWTANGLDSQPAVKPDWWEEIAATVRKNWH